MKRIILPVVTFVMISLSTSAIAANPNANWRALVNDAHGRSDAILSGTVESVEDQTAVDGGYVYSLTVTDKLKGSPPQHVSVRAGGFTYSVPLEMNEEVILFLRKGPKNVPKGRHTDYTLVEVDGVRPMAFSVSGENAHAVDGRLQAEFASVKVADLKQYMASIQP